MAHPRLLPPTQPPVHPAYERREPYVSNSAMPSDDSKTPKVKRRLAFGLVGGVAALAVAASAVAATGGAAAGKGSSSPKSLKVMSLNTWHGGAKVPDGVNKITKQIKASGADVVALQESSSDVTKEIAGKLGGSTTRPAARTSTS